jgi:enterochelin esterase family protein
MPLSQILIDGEGWKKVEKAGEKPRGIDFEPMPGVLLARETTHSPDGATLFLAVPDQRFLFAAPLRRDGNVASPAVSYAPLRTRRGQTSIEVTGLATDSDGRIYAATEIGVQVFDPTGRLCGGLTPAEPGKPEHLAFEGDQLTMWIGDTKYTRKLNTTGAK